MNKKDLKFLQELVETPSPSGFEQPAQRRIRKELEGIVDELKTDLMGNVIACIKGKGKNNPRVMLAGHCDEIGFIVQYIDDSGFIYFSPIGGVDPHLVPGQRVHIHTDQGPVLGVVGKKPIHLMEAKDRETVVKFKNQFIDIGSPSKDETASLVNIGDPVTIAVKLEHLQGDRLTSRAFDDKMGAFIVAQVLKEIRRRGPVKADVYGVFTVQEEVGLASPPIFRKSIRRNSANSRSAMVQLSAGDRTSILPCSRCWSPQPGTGTFLTRSKHRAARPAPTPMPFRYPGKEWPPP